MSTEIKEEPFDKDPLDYNILRNMNSNKTRDALKIPGKCLIITLLSIQVS